MKKMSQKIGIFVICAALSSSLAACGKDKKNSSGKTTAQTVQAGNDETAQTVPTKSKEKGASTWYTGTGRTEDEAYTMTTTTTTVASKKKTTKTTTTTTTTTTTATTTTTTKAAVKRDNQYKVSTKKYTTDDDKITYRYPQISGLYDEAMQNFYNKLFQSDMEKAVEEIGKGTLEVSYKVTYKTKDQLSIVFRGSSFGDGAAHPYGFAYVYNIDLATGGTFIPSEQISMSKAADAILDDKWSLVKAADGVKKSNIVDYFSQLGEEGTKNAITESNVLTVKQSGEGKYAIKKGAFCRSYLDGDAEPVLILELNHALGDYAEVKLS